MATLLKVDNLRKSFRSKATLKKHEVLKGISFEIEKGAVTGFLGSNGAGKTTTIKCLLGLIFPDSGQIDFFGQGYNSPEVMRKIGFLPERPYFYDYLTGTEILKFAGQLSGMSPGKELQMRIDELIEMVELNHAKDRRLREYSKGMLQRIGIAQALIHKPEFVILDEPMSGLDPDGRYKINSILQETANRGTTVFFSSHLLHDAEALCKNLVIVVKGQVAYTGSMNELLKKLQVGFLVNYREQNNIKSVSVSTEAELQSKIDELRASKKTILDIKNDRPTLEKAFVQISSGLLSVNEVQR